MARAALLPVALLLCLALACRADVARKTAGVYELKNKKGDFSISVRNLGDVVLAYDNPCRLQSLMDLKDASS
ncbi:unnamed protein product [Miscanthus lutarioriparius]|uniref:Uncharacterized protein n=1 Tax=Miscanthus lutarioriparius TaxID=422564 RepID=A0A811QR43_9POAL|nr:unnamed protein product [Miscanthus lutarioriparius]